MDTQHNTRALLWAPQRCSSSTHTTLQLLKAHARLAKPNYCSHYHTTSAGLCSLHSGPALSGYLELLRNLTGRGPKFFTGDLISVNQTSDNKGAICGCLWNWVTSVGGQGGWREYGKIFPTLSLQTHHHPICMNASHCFWQTTWCLVVFYSKFVDSN